MRPLVFILLEPGTVFAMTPWRIVALMSLVVLGFAGMAAGLVRDFYSRERATLVATVIAVEPAGHDYKSPTPQLNRLMVRLDDGREAVISSGTAGVLRGFEKGNRIRVIERITPWGQAWYSVAR